MLNQLPPEALTVVRNAHGQGLSFYLIGGSDAEFATAAAQLAALSGCRLHTLALLPAAVVWEGPEALVVSDDALGAADFLRSAGRQDPDCVIVDRRAGQAADILLQLRFTGHQLIAHLNDLEVLGPMSIHLVRDLVLRLGDQPAVAQFQDGQARLLFRREPSGEWVQLGEDLQPAPTPPPAPPEPVPLPPDWKPWDVPLVERLRLQLGPARRTCWLPRLEGQPSACGSHFGGEPLLRIGEAWPICRDCQAPLFPVLQLDLAAVPAAFQKLTSDRGYLQFFYCVSGSCACPAAWEPQAGNRWLRVLPEGDLVPGQRPAIAGAEYFGASAIAGWEERADFPDWEERQAILSGTEDLYGSWLDELRRVAEEPERLPEYQRVYPGYLEHFRLRPEDMAEVVGYFENYGGDKLLGWPAWTQAVDYPLCPTCAQPMTMLMQINNDGGGPESFFGQLFAADGNGHIFVCPEHQHLAFTWACG